MATRYVALFTAGGEVSGAGYARKATVIDIYEGRTGNTADVSWGPLAEPWGTATQMKLFAALTGGDPLYAAALTVPVVTQTGYCYGIYAGAIRFPEGILDTALLDEALLDQLELGSALPPVELSELTGTPYVALFTAGGEVTGASYARKPTAINIYEGRTGNIAILTWGAVMEPWGTATEAKLFAAASGGDPLYAAVLKAPVLLRSGYYYRICAGGIRFPEAILDTALLDEALLDQAELGTALLPVELSEVVMMPPPSTLPMRVMPGARRIM